MAPAIHFTHHLCRTVDRAAAEYPRDFAERYHRIWSVGHAPYWSPYRCSHGHGPSLRTHFTTELSRVTCRVCIRDVAREHEREEFDDGELVKRAWHLCCADRGAPSPLTEDDRAQLENERRAAQVKRIARIGLSVDLALMKHQIGDDAAGAWFHDKLADLARDLDPDVLQLAQPLFERWMFVGDLLAHVGDAIDEAKKLVEPFSRAVRAVIAPTPIPIAAAINEEAA
ncbi:MAG TPA: hypothetical protein VH143_32830 [Kofleriaceae bacterium]|nr:hypothetical protein [Kofleriaceae bacterium]